MAKRYKIDLSAQPSLFDSPDLWPTDDMPPLPSPESFVVESRERPASAGRRPQLDEPIRGMRSRDTVFFMSFGSGSSGNSAFVADNSGGFIIDAGVDPSKVKEGLARYGFSMADVEGIILTHDHSDHVHYVYSLVRRYPQIGVYCTPKAFGGIMRRHSISRRLKDYHKPIYKEFPFTIGRFEITAFEVSHDGTDNAGYHITHAASGTNLTVATDLGCITDRVEHYMSLSTHIMIEANYDAEMLRTGPYPMHLKARIAAERGHLDNEVTAAFLARVASPRLSDVFLCHLSLDNNTPAKALGAVEGALAAAGHSAAVHALPRLEVSQLFTLHTTDSAK